MNDTKYNEYVRDITIAEEELKRMKLYPNNILADFYCIPSCNYQAYYILLSKKDDDFEFTYIKPHIYRNVYSMRYDEPIKMYPFVYCKKAEGHDEAQGQFIMGVKKVKLDRIVELLKIFDAIPDKYIFEDDGICIDGVLQGIRIYGENKKKVFYRDATKINGLSSKQARYLDNLYLEMEQIVL